MKKNVWLKKLKKSGWDKMSNIYDIVIIGGGPAGLSAGIYGGRAKLKTAILEKGTVGGMAATTREMVNYPGFKTSTGPELTKAMADHAREFGTEINKDEVKDINLNGEIKVIQTKKGREYQTRAVIIAVGSQPRLLNIPGEKEFRGDGVSYCATCDAECYEGLHVVVVGNGDAAIEEAMFITKYASKVTIIVIHDEGTLDCNKLSAEKAFKNDKIEFIWKSVVTEIKGENTVTGVILKNLKTGKIQELETDGVFIYVGMVPETGFLKGKVEMDERGYLSCNGLMETSVSGVYAAGDVRTKYLRQVSTAVGDGATAAVAAERYIAEQESFRNYVLNSDKPILMAFWDPVVQESLDLLSVLEKTVADHGDAVNLIKIDMSRTKMIAQKYNVSKVPTVLYLQGKDEFTVFDDENCIAKLDAFLKRNI